MKSTAAILLGFVLCSGALCQRVPAPSENEADLEPGFRGFDEPDARTGAQLIAISGDGRVVVGQVLTIGDLSVRSFRWHDGTIDELNLLPSTFDASAHDVSRNGSVIVGQMNFRPPDEAFRWTVAEGMEGLGFLPEADSESAAYGVSADGSVVVGFSAGTNGSEAFRWTAETGLVGLNDSPGGSFNSFATAVSADGSVVVGHGATDDSDEIAFRWTAETGMVPLGDLPGRDVQSSAYAISADGSVIVGQSSSTPGPEAFRWIQAEGMVGLGNLPGGDFSSFASAVTADGSIVVGTSAVGPLYGPSLDFSSFAGIASSPYRAFIWDAAHGMRQLQDVLAYEYGLDVSGWTLTQATDISDDGRTIIGDGINPDGQQQPWIARLPSATITRSLEADLQTLAAMRAEIEALIATRTCSDTNQCAYKAVGSLPCGGPESYLVYSRDTVNEAVLAQKIQAYNSFDDFLNNHYAFNGGCLFVTPPAAVECDNGMCVAVDSP